MQKRETSAAEHSRGVVGGEEDEEEGGRREERRKWIGLGWERMGAEERMEIPLDLVSNRVERIGEGRRADR